MDSFCKLVDFDVDGLIRSINEPLDDYRIAGWNRTEESVRSVLIGSRKVISKAQMLGIFCILRKLGRCWTITMLNALETHGTTGSVSRGIS